MPFQDLDFADFHLPLFEWVFFDVTVGGGAAGVVTGCVTGGVTGCVTGGVTGGGTVCVCVGGGDGVR